jgi:hypothetical protein
VKLPRGNNSVVPLRKLTDYLLSESHPVGKSKAVFFRQIGFDGTNVRLLEASFLKIAAHENIVEVTSSPHGTKYVVDGDIELPQGGTAAVRTIWIIESEVGGPRFVTAYPR